MMFNYRKWGKIQNVAKKRNFDQILVKYQNFGQISNLGKISKFWAKIVILVKYQNLSQISKLWSNIKTSVGNGTGKNRGGKPAGRKILKHPGSGEQVLPGLPGNFFANCGTS